MDKWSLLFLSVLATVATVLSIVWWYQSQKLPTRDIEDIVGYDGSKLPEPERTKMSDRMSHLDGLGIPVIVFGTLMWVLVTRTIDAFFP